MYANDHGIQITNTRLETRQDNSRGWLSTRTVQQLRSRDLHHRHGWRKHTHLHHDRRQCRRLRSASSDGPLQPRRWLTRYSGNMYRSLCNLWLRRSGCDEHASSVTNELRSTDHHSRRSEAHGRATASWRVGRHEQVRRWRISCELWSRYQCIFEKMGTSCCYHVGYTGNLMTSLVCRAAIALPPVPLSSATTLALSQSYRQPLLLPHRA